MSTFRTPQIVHLPPEAVSRAQTFADTVIATVNYGDSNQTVKKKINDDHFVSKLGEEAARAVFESRGCIVEGPDYSIYRGQPEILAVRSKNQHAGSCGQNAATLGCKTIRTLLDVSRFARAARPNSFLA